MTNTTIVATPAAALGSDEFKAALALTVNPDSVDPKDLEILRQGAEAQDRLEAALRAGRARKEAEAKEAAARVAKTEAAIIAVEEAIARRRQDAVGDLAREAGEVVGELCQQLDAGNAVAADRAIKALQNPDLYPGVVQCFGSKKAYKAFLEDRRTELRHLFARKAISGRRRWHK